MPDEEDIIIPMLNDLDKQMSMYGSKAARKKWPYYNEDIAGVIASTLDKLHDTKLNPQRRSVKVLADRIAISTLRLQYYQGIHYLLDNMDEQGKYKRYYANTRAEARMHEGYLELFIRARGKEGFANTGIRAVQNLGDWKEPLQKFLEDSTPGSRFLWEEAFSKDDLAWVRGLLTPLGDLFIAKLEESSILIVRDYI